MNQAEYYDKFTNDVFVRYFSTYNKRIEQAKKLCKMFVTPGDRILEVGCGVGIIAKALQPTVGSYLGLDLSKSAIEIARQYVPAATFYVADILNFNLQTKFDAIILLDVIEHLEDLSFTLRRLEAYLAEDGRIILSWPTPDAIERLRTAKAEMQLVDNAVEVKHVLAATSLRPIYLNFFGVEHTNQYVQLVLTKQMPTKAVKQNRIINRLRSRWLKFKNRKTIEFLRNLPS